MKVSQAIRERRSVRAFLDRPVDPDLVRSLLEQSARAPSGGNLQPWKIRVVTGPARDRLVRAVQEQFDATPYGEPVRDHQNYPAELAPRYDQRRRLVGQQMYEAMGIDRADKERKWAHVRRTFDFFGAPVGMLVTIERAMEPIQWTDTGMFVQTVMLLAREYGLDTCPMGFWALFPKTIRATLGLPDDDIIICGLALGYADPDAPVNRFVSERAPLAETIFFHHA